jgi:sugar phosphate isomerase/epimerase
VNAIREVAEVMRSRGQYFLFETGQETPVTLMRAITDIGLDNVGINLDMANRILYGMACTPDAVDIFGKYVMNTHVKDGLFPTDPYKLGREVKAGEGRACIPLVIKKLYDLGYDGPFVVEREISGEEQKRDIIDTFAYLREIIKNMGQM